MALTMNLTNVQSEQAEFKTASGEIVTLTDAKGEQYFREMKAEIVPMQSGSGDPSPDNVRPISGFSEAKVTRTGKNLLKLSESEMESFGWNRDFPISVKAGTYILSCENKFGKDGSEGASIAFADENNNTIGNALSAYTFGDSVFVGTPQTFTTEQVAKIKKIKFGLRARNTTFAEIAKGNIQLELSLTATDYEPYQGEEVTVQLGQTVYGGTLDVRRGKVRVTHKYWTENGSATWSETTTGGARYYCSGVSTDAVNASTNGCCNIGNLVNNFHFDGVLVGSNGRINLCGSLHSAFADVTALKSYLQSNPIEVVYELAEPFDLTVTPEAIKTLTGENNVWADTGEITVTYKVDPDAEPTLTLAHLGANLVSLRPIATEAEEIIAESEDPENGANLSTESEAQNGETEME